MCLFDEPFVQFDFFVNANEFVRSLTVAVDLFDEFRSFDEFEWGLSSI